jgi:hypothetical protein
MITNYYRALTYLESVVGSGEHENFCKCLINISMSCGFPIETIKIFLKEEFRRSAGDQV